MALHAHRIVWFLPGLILFCWLLPGPGHAQQGPVTERNASEAQWRKASEGLDYSKDKPKPPRPPRERRGWGRMGEGLNWTNMTANWGTAAQAIALVAAIGIIAFLIFRMLQEPRNRVIARDGAVITLENVDEYILETDLERFIREALAAGNYAQAIRLYYLQAIKQLSERKYIQWAKDKTNREYIRELRGHRLQNEFKSATLDYEKVWYGNLPLNREGYQALEPRFQALLKNI